MLLYVGRRDVDKEIGAVGRLPLEGAVERVPVRCARSFEEAHVVGDVEDVILIGNAVAVHVGVDVPRATILSSIIGIGITPLGQPPRVVKPVTCRVRPAEQGAPGQRIPAGSTRPDGGRIVEIATAVDLADRRHGPGPHVQDDPDVAGTRVPPLLEEEGVQVRVVLVGDVRVFHLGGQ